MAEVFLRRLSRWQAEQQREDVATVYTACHGQAELQKQARPRNMDQAQAPGRAPGRGQAPYAGSAQASYTSSTQASYAATGRPQAPYGSEGYGRAGFLGRFERHVQERDFDMVTAHSASGLVGCLYGYRATTDTPDFATLRDVLPPAATGAAAAGRLFLLVELMVLPEHRRRRVATRMRDLLLARHGTDVVVTTLTAAAAGGDGTAHEVLRAWSCTKLGEFGTPPREAWLHPA
ncbi:hypothetical protein C9F11_22535 [Streptomyces sp. YIM 121038]|uniref:hypothetical protein n=1 Tax=Streptomyces sp. YIM 121038 TaxID=2136401 RepID=UPI0011109253|nr:hypothetical protein [Streptomyces sp. YIM 121038]QCX78134.1 hypothetical protein C9F11_22535 [Streptomyces sp. YIM 121038]